MGEPALVRIDTGVTDVWLGGGGILWKVVHEGAAITAESARRRPLLVDIRGARSVTRDAREHLSGPRTAGRVCAAALVVGNPLSRAMGNFFLGFNRASFPTRLSGDVGEALARLVDKGR